MKIVKERERLLAAAARWRAPRRWPASARRTSTSSATSRRRATSRCRSSPTARAASPALGERECSIQRRHQKLVEEAPSVALTDEEREQLLAVCEKAMRAIGYTNVGTIEFLYESGQLLLHGDEHAHPGRAHGDRDGHRARSGARADPARRGRAAVADASPARFRPRGHAIECRINAEDPVTFAPSPGRITALNLPGGFGVRVDTHIYEGYVVPPNYDSLLAKLIVHAEDREAAIRRLRRALGEFVIEGIKTNLAFHRRLVDHPDFVAG